MAIKQINYNNYNYSISYEFVNPTCEKTLIFLHGWGSNKNIMKQAFGSLFIDYKHLYIDMPGFGNSVNDVALTTQDYKNIIQTFLHSLNIDAEMIFGHSFGGKVATLMQPKKLVLLSTAGIVEKKSFKVKFKIFLAKVMNALGLSKLTKAFRSSDVNTMSEQMYQTFKNVVNEDFSSIFASCESETYIFWGNADTATSLDSGKTIHNLIKNSQFKEYDGDHYFFLRYAKDIEKCLI